MLGLDDSIESNWDPDNVPLLILQCQPNQSFYMHQNEFELHVFPVWMHDICKEETTYCQLLQREAFDNEVIQMVKNYCQEWGKSYCDDQSV